MNLQNLTAIPEELKKLKQWVCFDVSGDKKIPYIPGSNSEAASNRRTDWRSYRAALQDVKDGKRTHVGFVFSEDDPYVFIDLDDIKDKDQRTIYEKIHTYAQRSVGGSGIHLIARGNFKGPGKHPKKPKAGIFKTCRFCVMTGDIYRDRREILDVPDVDLQAVHTWLGGSSHERSSSSPDLVEYASEIPDKTVFEMGCDRFHKYEDLSAGKWEHYEEYAGDHSTADHAFIAMLCDLTESNEQVRWLFKASGMWTAERAAKKAAHGPNGYIDRTIRKVRAAQSRDREARGKIHIAWGEDSPGADLDQSSAKKAKKAVTSAAPVAAERESLIGPDNLIESLPDGLVKSIAQYSFKSSFHPLQEASLCVALMLLSGICGRGWLTPTKAGLNLWLVLVGGTSCGKDEYQSGIKRLLNSISKELPHVRKIYGGELVSGPAIETVFQDTLRYISFWPEFGESFKNIANPASSEHIVTLRRGLLNSFNSAGVGGSSEGRKRAQKSEDKQFVERPCLCIAGDATPEKLYGSMTTAEIASGLLQRFMVLDVPRSSWSIEENAKAGMLPNPKLVEDLVQLCSMADTLDVKNNFKTVSTSDEAALMLKSYRMDKRLRNADHGGDSAVEEIMNRAGLKATKLASLLAVSTDWHAPRIEEEHARWAIDFVESLDSAMLSRFSTGDIGSGQVKQEAEIIRAFVQIATASDKQRKAMGMPDKLVRDRGAVTLAALKAKVVGKSAFASDKAGAVTAFDRSVESMVRAGVLIRLRPDQAADEFDVVSGSVLCMENKALRRHLKAAR